jgi:hypothetical protein
MTAAGAVHHERRLLRFGLDRHIACARPRHRLADRLGIGPVILVPAHLGFNVPRRDEADVMAEIAQLTRPVMPAGAGLQPDEPGRELGEKRDHMSAAQAPLEEDRSCCVDTVHGIRSLPGRCPRL